MTKTRRPHRRTGRRRGAPYGNTNALKHGLYSTRISADEEASLPGSPDPLLLLRLRLKGCLKMQAAHPDQWFSYERAIFHYLRYIITLSQDTARLNYARRSGALDDVLASVWNEMGLPDLDAPEER